MYLFANVFRYIGTTSMETPNDTNIFLQATSERSTKSNKITEIIW